MIGAPWSAPSLRDRFAPFTTNYKRSRLNCKLMGTGNQPATRHHPLQPVLFMLADLHTACYKDLQGLFCFSVKCMAWGSLAIRRKGTKGNLAVSC